MNIYHNMKTGGVKFYKKEKWGTTREMSGGGPEDDGTAGGKRGLLDTEIRTSG